MSSYNKVMLMGNLTRDIEIRHTQSNTAVGNFGIAINRKWKSKDGQQNEEVTFIDCEAWGRTAEVIAQYLGKGDPIFIDGRLKLDQWDDKNGGGKRSKVSVVVESFQFVGKKSEGGGSQQSSSRGAGSPQTVAHDDIPFSHGAWEIL